MSAVFERKWQVRLVAALFVAFLALAPGFAREAAAHPLGNFTTNRYARVEVYQDRLQVHYVVDMAEIPTFQAMDTIDADGDDVASDAELATFAERRAGEIAKGFELALGGKALDTNVAQASAQLLPGQGGLDVLRLAVVYDAPATSSGSAEVSFHDRNFADSQGWKEVVVRGSDGAVVSGAEPFAVDQSDALRSYPAESLRSAPNVSEARFTWEVGTGAAAPAVVSAQLASEGRAAGGFAGIFADLSDGDVTLGFLALSLLVAFAFGAQHALGPGHGKTMVAAYLVGSRGTPKHAVALGLTVTATHTSTVYLLGAVTLLASAWLTPEKVYLWMGVAAGVMVVGFGLALLVQRTWSYRKAQAASGVHRHGLFGKAHSHGHAQREDSFNHGDTETRRVVGGSDVGEEADAHEHADGHHHAHSHDHEHGSPFPVPVSPDGSRVTWRSLLSLGVLGGLLPCPSAVVVMVAAISQGQVLLGMLLIVAFSRGLAGVLMAIGVSLVLGRKVPARQRRLLERPLVARAIAVMPVVSAVIVTVVGLGLTYQAVGRV